MRDQADIRVAALALHPLKSGAGLRVAECALDELGVVGDRRWMLVDEQGVAITAREVHRLLAIRASYLADDRNGGIVLEATGAGRIEVPAPCEGAEGFATVWGATVRTRDAGDSAAEWCGVLIGRPCRLVRVHEAPGRALAAKYAGPIDRTRREVAFPDGAPLLVLGLASIAALESRVREPEAGTVVDVRRFRANILLSGTTPHEEDRWLSITIGNLVIGIGEPCSRCVLTTVDPDTTEQGLEPLRTLATYRRQPDGVMFGMNATHAAPGIIRVGDLVRVLRRRD